MAGQRQKAPAMLANGRGGRGRALVVPVRPPGWKPPPLPIPARDASPRVRRWWRDFWLSPVSSAVDLGADAERLHQWVRAMQDREDLMAQVRAAGWKVPTGDTWTELREDGTAVVVRRMVPHPLLQHVKHLDREIARLAEHFGMTPLSRFRLQLTYSEAGQSEIKLRRARERANDRPPAAEVIDLDAMG